MNEVFQQYGEFVSSQTGHGIHAALGLLLGWVGIGVLQRFYPDFPFAAPLWAPVTAVLISLASGLGFGVLPASRAARLDPVQALARR